MSAMAAQRDEPNGLTFLRKPMGTLGKIKPNKIWTFSKINFFKFRIFFKVFFFQDHESSLGNAVHFSKFTYKYLHHSLFTERHTKVCCILTMNLWDFTVTTL